MLSSRPATKSSYRGSRTVILTKSVHNEESVAICLKRTETLQSSSRRKSWLSPFAMAMILRNISSLRESNGEIAVGLEAASRISANHAGGGRGRAEAGGACLNPALLFILNSNSKTCDVVDSARKWSHILFILGSCACGGVCLFRTRNLLLSTLWSDASESHNASRLCAFFTYRK